MSLITRRNFFLGLIAAPVVVRASSLMPISAKAIEIAEYPSFISLFVYEGGYSPDVIHRLELTNETWVSIPGTSAYRVITS